MKKLLTISIVLLLVGMFVLTYVFVWINTDTLSIVSFAQSNVQSGFGEVLNFGEMVSVDVQKPYYNGLVIMPSYFGEMKVTWIHDIVLYYLPILTILFLITSYFIFMKKDKGGLKWKRNIQYQF